MIPLHFLPEEATVSFFSEDNKAAFLPILFEPNITSKEIKVALADVLPLVKEHTNLDVHVTGPAGIAVDATDLFSRADLVLLFSTVGIILILLIVTYRSPLLARSEEHTSELQSRGHLVCRLLLEKKDDGRIITVERLQGRHRDD